jgi:hypothetical protein
MTFDYLRTLYVCVCGKNDSRHRCDECMALLAKPSMTRPHPEWFDCATRRSDHQPPRSPSLGLRRGTPINMC